MNHSLFFDSASTTRCCNEASELIHKFDCDYFGNPSSTHELGLRGQRAIEEARKFFADHFQVQPDQVIFTGSGTESDNLAICGFAHRLLANGETKTYRPRFITSTIEHPAVRDSMNSLGEFGFDIRQIGLENGGINETEFLDLITNETKLISIIKVNNITGLVVPVEDLAKKAKKKNPDVIFHTDCVQTFGRIDVPSKDSGVDMISISGHKIEGPKGVGALIVYNRKIIDEGMIRPLVFGGGQEMGLRSGTQNAGLIAGFMAAAKRRLSTQKEYFEHARKLKDHFLAKLKERKLLGTESSHLEYDANLHGIPHIVNLQVRWLPARRIADKLNQKGCFVATGSACSSGKVGPDKVLTAMGKTAFEASSSLRISFSNENSVDDVDIFVDKIAEAISELESLLDNK